MNEERFKIYDKETLDTHIEDTKDLYSDGTPKAYWFMENEDFCDLFDVLNELNDEVEQLKQELSDFKQMVYGFEDIVDLKNWQQKYENK